MHIFLIRHGESLKNVGKCDLEDWKVPLTNKGENQALQVGQNLLNYCKTNNISLDNSIIISSPYIRAKQTANNINKYLNLPLLINYSISEYQHYNQTTDNIEELDEYNKKLSTSCPVLKKFIDNQVDENQNENNVEIVLRAKSVISRLKSLPYDNVFIVSHKGFIKAFITAFNNNNYSSYFEHHVVENCSVKLFDIDHNIFQEKGNILNP